MTLNILFASSEITPFAKTGGLGDVGSALPRALSSLGHKVTAVLPLYGSIPKKKLENTHRQITVALGGEPITAEIFKSALDNKTDVLFIDQPELFGNRPNPYGDDEGDYPDNDLRFIFFNRAIVELAKSLPNSPDVLHCNDWQCGLAPLYLKLERENGNLQKTASVFTIHNLAYQGHFPKKSFGLTGLPKSFLKTAGGVLHHGKLATLKTGILFADAVTTVSPTYARETLAPELGFGLEGFLKKRGGSFRGILNGIDTDEWNPEKDRLIPQNYSVKNFSGKTVCRTALLKKFGLEDNPARPVVGMVSRLIEQKGFDIIETASDDLMKLDFSLVVLGTGQKEYETFLRELAEEYPGRVGVEIGYDNALSHLIEAGADIFLMPSRFEPCGLNQMYSLRYGTPPVVRATGGLNDTVTDWNPETGEGNGFVFSKPSPDAMLKTVGRAVSTFGKKDEWRRIIRNGMNADLSWQASAREYTALYRSLL